MKGLGLAATAASSTLVFVVLVLSLTNPVRGGICWSSMSHGARCTDLLQEKVSREECCAMGSESTAWSDKDMDPGMLFFWRVLGGGVPCQPCKDSCAGVSCGAGRRCALRWGRPKCVCAPDCSRAALAAGLAGLAGLPGQQANKTPRTAKSRAGLAALAALPHRGSLPVCGSDGRSYRSACRLLKRACRQKNSNLVIAYLGTCQTGSCDRVHCGQGRSCVLDQNMSPHCVRCERRCGSAGSGLARTSSKTSSRTSSPRSAGRAVCGSDGVTYPSACHLREAACRAGKAIPVAYRGRCQRVASCGAVKCKHLQSCLTDMASGKPRCVTCAYRCPKHGHGAHRTAQGSASTTMTTSKARRRGGAILGDVLGGGGGARVRELASLEASLEPGGPICGSNNRTYPSWCLMMKDACATGYVIETQHQGACGPARSLLAGSGGAEPAVHLNTVLDDDGNAGNAFS